MVDVVDGETQGLGHTELPVVVLLRKVFESEYFSRCHQVSRFESLHQNAHMGQFLQGGKNGRLRARAL